MKKNRRVKSGKAYTSIVKKEKHVYEVSKKAPGIIGYRKVKIISHCRYNTNPSKTTGSKTPLPPGADDKKNK